MTAWYDTKGGIQEAVSKGIAGLKELSKARGEAGYKRKERMREWCVLGIFWLDTCGNFSLIIEDAPADHRGYHRLGDVQSREELSKAGLAHFSSTPMYSLPPVVEKCDRCLRGWDMQNIRDYHQRRNPESPHRHESCHKLWEIEEEQAYFKEVMDQSGMPYTSMRAIPNGYSRSYSSPWFLVETKWGPLRIGWRKRVINIDWGDSQINHNGDITFKDQKVTTWRVGVHAWGKDKAIEYLRVLSQGNFDN